MDFISHSNADRARMLKAIGAADVGELIGKVIPEKFQLNRPLDLPSGISEYEITREFGFLNDMNDPASESLCFMGGGSYDHYIPSSVGVIASRSEFSTAYTPYQAEVSQGTLQTIYEFQTMICRLTGMDVANASHYDGASAVAEAVRLAARKTGRNKVVLPYGLNPNFRATIKTYCDPVGIELILLEGKDGIIDGAELKEKISGAACFVLQQPNFFGLLEPTSGIADIVHSTGALLIASVYPTTLALLQPPGEWGADIVTGEGQSLGIPMSMGGPYFGLFATTKELVRLMPGRLVARAKDAAGRGGFVLTLQTREQHIRREKATSNICTNEALIALQALIYLSLLGPDGLQKAAMNSYRGAHYLAKKLTEIPGVRLCFGGDFFNEFALHLPVAADKVQAQLIENGLFVGPLLGKWFAEHADCLLVAVTEKRDREELDLLAEAITAAVA